jgi:hypothetical protein
LRYTGELTSVTYWSAGPADYDLLAIAEAERDVALYYD